MATLTSTHGTYFPRRVTAYHLLNNAYQEIQGMDLPVELASTTKAPIGTQLTAIFDMNVETGWLYFSTLWSRAASYNPMPMDWRFEVWGVRLP